MRMRTRQQRGFTLIEMLVVIVIIATLATGVVLSVSDKPAEAKKARVQSDIATISAALEMFRLNMDRYPTDEEGLEALVYPPDSEDQDRWKKCVPTNPKDPWGEPYLYYYPGEVNVDSYDIMSLGADKMEGGEKEAADMGNWDEETLEGAPIN